MTSHISSSFAPFHFPCSLSRFALQDLWQMPSSSDSSRTFPSLVHRNRFRQFVEPSWKGIHPDEIEARLRLVFSVLDQSHRETTVQAFVPCIACIATLHRGRGGCPSILPTRRSGHPRRFFADFFTGNIDTWIKQDDLEADSKTLCRREKSWSCERWKASNCSFLFLFETRTLLFFAC